MGRRKAFSKRRELVKLLVESIIAGRDEEGKLRVEITYRFGPPTGGPGEGNHDERAESRCRCFIQPPGLGVAETAPGREGLHEGRPGDRALPRGRTREVPLKPRLPGPRTPGTLDEDARGGARRGRLS